MTARRRSRPHLYACALLIAIAVAVSAIGRPQASAGPLTSGVPTKLSIYQGLLTIIPGGTGESVMEIGNAGADIASTGTIALRPGSVDEAHGIRFDGSRGTTDLHILGGGRLCLNGACVPPWPTSGGTSLWQTSGSVVQPVDLSHGLSISAPESFSVLDKYALAVYGNATARGSLYVSNSASGQPAMTVDGNAYLRGNVEISSTSPATAITVGGNAVWHSANDGAGSGLDASYLDGIDLTTRTSPDNGLCGMFNGILRCVTLN